VDNKLAAYARLVPAGISYPDYISIGRVITSPAHRRTGIGKALMQQAVQYCYNLFNTRPIKIGAQYHLKKFYEEFGFVQSSEVYDEDGIPHIQMVKE
jgi:ElaA protein